MRSYYHHIADEESGVRSGFPFVFIPPHLAAQWYGSEKQFGMSLGSHLIFSGPIIPIFLFSFLKAYSSNISSLSTNCQTNSLSAAKPQKLLIVLLP